MLKEGIILLASEHTLYGRLAYNLCLSVKAVDASFPIALVHDSKAISHLSNEQRGLFDQLIDMPCPGAFGAKLYLDQLTPFEKTLYLDVDMAWLPKYSPRDLIRSLKETDFACITEGSTEDPSPKYYYWADVDEIRKVYGIGKMYQWRSEVIYFIRSERVVKMFDRARMIYENPGLSTVHSFGGYVPDELAINIATALEYIEPHVYKWTPAYWPRLHGEHISSLEGLYTKYYALSCGSNVVSGNTKKLYDRIIKAAAYKLKQPYLFPMVNKRDVIKSRIKV